MPLLPRHANFIQNSVGNLLQDLKVKLNSLEVNKVKRYQIMKRTWSQLNVNGDRCFLEEIIHQIM